MSPTLTALVLLGIYFIYVGWSRRKSMAQDDDTYRYPSIFAVIAGTFTVVGAGEYALALDLTPAYGFVGPSLFLGLGIALLLISAVAPRVRDLKMTKGASSTYDKYQSFTTPDIFFVQSGKWASLASTFITVVSFLGILLLQLVLGGRLLGNLAGIPYEAAVCLLALVIGLYVILGRFDAVYHTDMFQGVLMWISLYVVVIYIFFIAPGTSELGTTLNVIAESSRNGMSGLWEDPTAWTIMIITIIAAFAGPDVWQRITMSKDHDEAVHASQISAIMMFLFILPLLLLAVHVRYLVPVDIGSELFYEYTAIIGQSSSSIMPWLLLLLFAIGLLGAFLSTADTSAMLIATAIGNERRRSNSTSEVNTYEVTIIVFLTVAVSGFFAIFWTDAAAAFTGVLGMLAAQGIPFLFVIFGKSHKIIVPIVLCLGAALALTQTFILDPMYAEGYYILLPAIPGILCVFLPRKKGECHD